MAKKRIHKNYYKNSRVQRRQRVIRRLLLSLKAVLLVGGIFGTSLLLILTYDAVTQSSYFEARTITVQGNQRFSKETILKQAGLKLNENILSVNLNAVRHRLMAHPWIAAAEIERELPDAIHIRVKERVPIAIVDLNRLFYLDEEGEIFKPVESSDKVRAPVVTGLSLSDIDFNDPWRSRLFRAVMEVLRSIRADQNVIPFRSLHRIDVDKETGLTLYAFFPPHNLSAALGRMPSSIGKADGRTQTSRNMVEIKVGFGDYESKYSRLQNMVSYLKKERGFLSPQSIDLNDLDRVVVRPSMSGQAGSRPVSGGQGLWSSRRKEV